MQFKSLENIPIPIITHAFNASFADYELPLQFSEEALMQKIQFEDIDLTNSVGAFDGEQLVGLIFFGFDGQTAWDGGTGVIPTYRGQKLTQRMLEYGFPILKANGINRVLLEVLENNTTAYKIYERAGFRPLRLLHAYKGEISTATTRQHNIEILNSPDFDVLLQMGEDTPPWQQMNKRIQNRGDIITTICIKANDVVAAYAHFDAKTGRVWQFATSSTRRQQGMAGAMFEYIGQTCNCPITVINVDESSVANQFLQSIGLNHFISQYEMDMYL